MISMSQEKNNHCCNPEMWGGIECTINRIHDGYADQLLSAGHYTRPSDIAKIAGLGISTLRYPILWEKHESVQNMPIDWSWTEQQLGSIRSHNMGVIAGLLHHGSGPSFTDLSDPHFPVLFAAYAGQVAKKFPWIEYYTPINEPLTTARFSGLYGLWYPHCSDALAFLQMLLNQVKGIVLAMQAIRMVNPSAKLVQTEDLACVHGAPALAYQVDFENERRWLTYDLLCGKVTGSHPLWQYLLFTGITEEELAFFSDNPCSPAVIGVNYYITSERYLDDDVAKYPVAEHGGNGRHTYVDLASVRVGQRTGLYVLLQEVWQRYRLPVSITEAHMNCTREEQMRWLNEVWDTACNAKNDGVDVRSVTAWALLGAYDWNSLLTRKDLQYESGAYAIIDHELHLTAVGHLIKKLASDGACSHPLLEVQGWWDRPPGSGVMACSQPLLLIGAVTPDSETLAGQLSARGIYWQEIDWPLNGLSADACATLVGIYHPWAIILLNDGGGTDDMNAANFESAGIPHWCLHRARLSGSAPHYDIQGAFDLFIDKAMTTTKKNSLISAYATK
jgi:dTDP-4-dehydrorhamnose reductase